MSFLRTTRLFVFIFAMIPFAADCVTAADNIEIKLTCRKKTLPQSREYQTGFVPAFKTAAPQGNWTLPDFKNRKPLFALIRLGDGERLLILDRAPENDAEMNDILSGFVDKLPDNAAFFNRLYFDANGNGNLTDDPVISARPVPASWGDGYTVTFESIEVSVPVKGVSLPNCFQLTVSTRMKCAPSTGTDALAKNLQSRFMPACYYEGKGEISGKKYCIALMDGNCNGIFYDSSSGDLLFLADSPDYGSDGMRCLDTVVVGKKTYKAAFDASSSQLVLSPPSQPLCKVKIPGDIHRLRLSFADKPDSGVVMFNPAEEVSIPAGRYVMAFVMCVRKDKDGNQWELTANSRTALADEVQSDKTVVFSFGEPFAVTATVSPVDSKGNVRMSSARMIGAGGEEVTKLVCVDQRQAGVPFSRREPAKSIAPSYRIFNSKQELVGRGKFEFG